MLNSFVAMDFETANYQSDSACAIGLVRVESNQIVAERYCLIRPPSSDFVFTYIHGITWAQVEKAPSFKTLWPDIESLFLGVDFIAAHNASFDQRVLNACCKRYEISPPQIEYNCTVKLARKRWGIYPTNLPAVCRALEIPLEHHNAMSDALACAKIVLAANLGSTAPFLQPQRPNRQASDELTP